MSVLSKIIRSTAEYQKLAKLVEAQKREIRDLKADRKERKARAERKLAETVEAITSELPGIYPIPRLLLAQPHSESIAERLLELVGLVLAARIARRAVCVDWRDGVHAPWGKNAFWSLFLPSMELQRRPLDEVDSYFHIRHAPTLPPPAAGQDDSAWAEFFSFTRTHENQVLIAQADPWWRERLPQAWRIALTQDGKVTLDDVERMALLSLFRPKRAILDQVARHLDGVPVNDCLGVFAPQPSADLETLLKRAVGELETQRRKMVWLYTDSAALREAFTQALGDRVIHLTGAPDSPAAQLAIYQAISHAPSLMLGGSPAESRLIYLISGLRPKDVTWLREPQFSLFGRAGVSPETR